MDAEEPTPEQSNINIAIIGLVSICTLAAGIIIYSGVGNDQIDMVFGMAIGAIAGLVSK